MTDKKRAKPQIRKKELFLAAYDSSLGNVSVACKSIKVARNTYYDWYRDDKTFQSKIDEINESALDFSETMLKKNIRDGKEASIFFHLKTKGKSRGYVEKADVEHSGQIIYLGLDANDLKA